MDNHARAKVSGLIFEIISSTINAKEVYPHNRSCSWSDEDIDFIRKGFKLLNEKERVFFLEKYKDYQIAKQLIDQ